MSHLISSISERRNAIIPPAEEQDPLELTLGVIRDEEVQERVASVASAVLSPEDALVTSPTDLSQGSRFSRLRDLLYTNAPQNDLAAQWREGMERDRQPRPRYQIEGRESILEAAALAKVRKEVLVSNLFRPRSKEAAEALKALESMDPSTLFPSLMGADGELREGALRRLSSGHGASNGVLPLVERDLSQNPVPAEDPRRETWSPRERADARRTAWSSQPRQETSSGCCSLM